MTEHRENAIITLASTVLGMGTAWLIVDPIGKIVMSLLTGAGAMAGGLLMKWAIHKISRSVKEYRSATGEM